MLNPFVWTTCVHETNVDINLFGFMNPLANTPRLHHTLPLGCTNRSGDCSLWLTDDRESVFQLLVSVSFYLSSRRNICTTSDLPTSTVCRWSASPIYVVEHFTSGCTRVSNLHLFINIWLHHTIIETNQSLKYNKDRKNRKTIKFSQMLIISY